MSDTLDSEHDRDIYQYPPDTYNTAMIADIRQDRLLPVLSNIYNVEHRCAQLVGEMEGFYRLYLHRPLTVEETDEWISEMRRMRDKLIDELDQLNFNIKEAPPHDSLGS